MAGQLSTFGPNADFARALNGQDADFLVIGGLAVVFHSCRDSTAVDDLDLLINPTEDNAQRVLKTLSLVGYPVACSPQELARCNVQIPLKQYFYLDILTPPPGISFEGLSSRSVPARLNGIAVRVPSREDLTALKQVAVSQTDFDREKHENDLRCLKGSAQQG